MPEKGKRIGGTKPGGFESCLIAPTDSEISIEDLLSIVNLQAGHARELRLAKVVRWVDKQAGNSHMRVNCDMVYPDVIK